MHAGRGVRSSADASSGGSDSAMHLSRDRACSEGLTLRSEEWMWRQKREKWQWEDDAER